MNCFERRILRAGWACTLVALACSRTVNAGSHSWDFTEVFSTADGSIQFIELMETSGMDNEVFLAGKKVISAATGNEFTFPANLVPPTGDKHLLLATAGFAALPGAPTPDYIIVDGFFDPDGDSLTYHVYDTFTFGKGQVPTDCINSLSRDGSNDANTPTNYQNESGTVDACPADVTTPDDFNAFRGFLDSGTLADVLESDDSDLCHDLGITIFPTEAPITLDFFGTVPNNSPSTLDVTIESAANTPGLGLTILFWNFNTASWDVVGTAAQGFNTDTVRTFAGTPADHVEVGTGAVRTRYEVRQAGIIFQFPWTDCIDHVYWTTSN